VRRCVSRLLLVLLPLAGAALTGAAGPAPDGAGPAEDFDRVEGDLPAGWQPITFSKARGTTAYAVVETERGPALRGHAVRAASGLVWERPFDPHAFPLLAWRWKVAGVLPGGDITRKSADDVPARLLVMFPFRPEEAGAWERTKFEVYRVAHGRYPPARALSYVWANKAEVGRVATSAFTDRSRLVVVESGAAHAGQWRRAERNIAEDFRRAFPGEPLPHEARLGILVDSDDTEGEATAWFDEIRLSPLPQRAAGG